MAFRKYHSSDWEPLLPEGGRRLLDHFGRDLDEDENPFTDLIAEDVRRFQDAVELFDVSIKDVAKSVIVAQMKIFDAHGGPEEDGEAKQIRRHWYVFYKTKFAIPYSKVLGEDMQNDDKWGTRWFKRMSTIYGELVETYLVTYLDLWVEDGSRKTESFLERLFEDCNIIVAVEKDSLIADFENAARSLGAQTIYSGKGKSARAAIERLLRIDFEWSEDHDPFTEEDPLIIIHVSDFDYDGEQVIGKTFAQQARRYSEHVVEARIGINPQQVDSTVWTDSWYEVKVKKNKAYQLWADTMALRVVRCNDCGVVWIRNLVQDLEEEECSNCGMFELVVDPEAYGFEVEALRTRAYYPVFVDALLSVLDFDYIIEKLRDECIADTELAAEGVLEVIRGENETYQALLDEFRRLEAIKDQFETGVIYALEDAGRPYVGDWRDLEDDPTPEEYQGHVEGSGNWTGPWRPFDQDLRTAELEKWLLENEEDLIGHFKQERIIFENDKQDNDDTE